MSTIVKGRDCDHAAYGRSSRLSFLFESTVRRQPTRAGWHSGERDSRTAPPRTKVNVPFGFHAGAHPTPDTASTPVRRLRAIRERLGQADAVAASLPEGDRRTRQPSTAVEESSIENGSPSTVSAGSCATWRRQPLFARSVKATSPEIPARWSAAARTRVRAEAPASLVFGSVVVALAGRLGPPFGRIASTSARPASAISAAMTRRVVRRRFSVAT